MPEPRKQIEQFAQRIFFRGDGLDNVVPVGYEPNWKDRPSTSRMYDKDVPRIPLPTLVDLHQAYAVAATAANGEKHRPPSVSQVALLLYLTSGLLRRKLDINWNVLPNGPHGFLYKEYARGTASGGGLYPTQMYLAVAPGFDLKPGLYHYCAPEHALVLIRHGDWTNAIAEAVSTPLEAVQAHPFFLVFAEDFWTNCFKYHNFGYHVVSEDVGVMLAQTELIGDSIGIAHHGMLSFNDSAINAVLGVSGQQESAFAVVGLGNVLASSKARAGGVSALPSVPAFWQRSRKVDIPAELQRVHALTLLSEGLEGPPQDSSVSQPSLSRLEKAIGQHLPSVSTARRSAWNSMQGRGKFDGAQLEELLRFISRRCGRTSMRETLPPNSLVLTVRVNNIAGYEPGAYTWNPTTETLEPKSSSELAVWQSTYAMQNYNIDQTGCILFVTACLGAVLDCYGARGYRILNAYVGMVSQLAYLAAAALGLDCGAVLGVRAQHVKKVLQLDADQNVFMAVYLSRLQQRAELFRFQIAPDIPIWNPVE